MPVVKMPDGTLVDMPEVLSESQLQALQSLQKPKPSVGSEALKVLDQSVRGGVFALPNAVKDFGNFLESKFPTPEWSKIQIPESVRNLYEKVSTPEKPETPTGKILGLLGEGAVGGMFGPGGMTAPLRSAAIGASAAGGSEAAARLLGEGALPRVLGGLAGGMGAGALTSSITNRKELANLALKDVNEQDLRLAQEEMKAAAANGTPINLSQAMGRESNIDKLVSILANSKEGQNTINLLRNQPAQAQNLADQFVTEIPGMVRSKADVANAAQKGATSVIQDAKDARSALWRSTLEKGQKLTGETSVSLDAVKAAQDKLLETAYQLPNTDKAAWLTNLAQKLEVGGLPITDPKQLNEILKEAADGLKPVNLQKSGVQAGSTNFLAGQIQELRKDLGESFKPIRAANAAYRDFTESRVNPLKEGVVGKVAQPAGAVEGKAAAESKIFQIFDAGTDPRAATSDIRTLAKEMKKSNQGDAFVDGAKTWLSDKLATAVEEVGGRGNRDFAATLHSNLFKTDKQKQGFRDIMSGIAKAKNLDESAMVNGSERFFHYLGQLSRRPATTEGASGVDFRRAAEDSFFGKMGQVSVITPLRQPILKYVEWLRSDAYSAMDKLINTPEGVDMLTRLAKEPKISPAVAKSMSTFLGTSVGVSNADPVE